MAAISPSPRAVWKGSVKFGLLHIPVALYAATVDQPVDFDWLDKRTMDPVGYKRINKTTGENIAPENVVKGVAVEPGRYVVISEAELAAAYPKATKTLDLETFVSSSDIPFVYLGRAYYMAPVSQGHKLYALLRDTLCEAGRIGLGRLVLHGRQHLTALFPAEPGLMLNVLRWEADIRPWTALDRPPLVDTSRALGVSARESAMARELVDGMAGSWQPAQYADTFNLLTRKSSPFRGRMNSVDGEDGEDGEAILSPLFFGFREV